MVKSIYIYVQTRAAMRNSSTLDDGLLHTDLNGQTVPVSTSDTATPSLPEPAEPSTLNTAMPP